MNCENNCTERTLYETLMIKCLLLSPNLIPKCQLQPETFLSPAFRNIYREIRNLNEQGTIYSSISLNSFVSKYVLIFSSTFFLIKGNK